MILASDTMPVFDDLLVVLLEVSYMLDSPISNSNRTEIQIVFGKARMANIHCSGLCHIVGMVENALNS